MPVLSASSFGSTPRRRRSRAGRRLLPWALLALIWALATISLVMGSRIAAALGS